MIKQLTMYTLICDNCGQDASEGEDYSCWSEPDWVIDGAEESGWYVEDKHYCPDCFSWDDEDKLVINESRKKYYYDAQHLRNNPP